jgi:hypothetical protein
MDGQARKGNEIARLHQKIHKILRLPFDFPVGVSVA